MIDGRPVGTPKGCKAWRRPQSHSWHRGAHRIGSSCYKSTTTTQKIAIAILTDRGRNQ